MSGRSLPPIDLHAHVDGSIPGDQLEQLGAVVFAVTRSLSEFETVAKRRDLVTFWGLGCHPGVPEAISEFSLSRFKRQLESAVFVGEIGIDGRSSVPRSEQTAIFQAILDCLVDSPRIASVHSAGATASVVGCLAELMAPGVVLHWWRGTAAQTRRAVELGCYFSVNDSMRDALPIELPPERILTETDHPYGNRSCKANRQPGAVSAIEAAISRRYGLTPDLVRSTIWNNFISLLDATGGTPRLSRPVQKMLTFASRDNLS